MDHHQHRDTRSNKGYRTYEGSDQKKRIRVVLIEGKYPKSQDEADFFKRIIRWVERRS